MKRFLGEASYLATVVLLTVGIFWAYGQWNQHIGAQRVIADSLYPVVLRRADSIVTEIATFTTYRILRRNDSIIRARRVACGPMLKGC